MVKPDVKRNYYADLELSPTADTQEISKAFKKLARVYHPDRNRGKEEECVPKFQAIQAAHEILSDPVTRAQYDEDRRKKGYTSSFARPNNATRNPYAQSYRPPPRPPQKPQGAAAPPPPPPHPRPQYTHPESPNARPSYFSTPRPGSYWGNTGQTPQFGQTPSPGTPQYQNFNRPPPPPPHQKGARDESRERADAWSAFGSMYNRKPPTARSAAPDQNDRPRPRAQQEGTPTANRTKPGLGRSQTTKTPRKAGFNPSNLDGEYWEPTSRTSSYTNFAKAPFAPGEAPPPPAGPPPFASNLSPNDGKKRHSVHETRRPVSADDVPFAEGSERISTPYASHVGEKTYFTSVPLGRTSIRKPKSAESPGATASASGRPTNQPNTSRARSTSPPVQTGPFATSARPSPNVAQGPKANSAKQRAKTSSERNNLFEMYDSSSDDVSSVSSLNRSSDVEPGAAGAGPFGKPAQRNKAQPGKNWRSRTSTSAETSDISSASANREDPSNQQRQEETTPSRGMNDSPSINKPMFSAPFYIPGNTPNSAQRTQNVNTQFSSDQWAGAFFGADFAVPPPPSVSQSRQTRSQSRRAKSPSKQAPPTKQWFDEPAGNAEAQTAGSAAPEPPPAQPERPSGPVKFSSEEWSKHFAEPTWAFPPTASGPPSTSPTRATFNTASRKGSRTPMTRKGSKVAAEPKVPQVRVAQEAEEPTAQQTTRAEAPPQTVPLSKIRSAPGASRASGPPASDAMDIDKTPSPQTPSVFKGPRLVPVQPSRPDWREGSTLLTGAVPPTSTASPTTTFPPPPPLSELRKAQQSKKADKDSINLKDFATTAPLAPTGDGIQGISDLASSLPFDSKSSTLLPSKPLTPHNLTIPPIPKGPEIPSNPSLITHPQWKSLLSRMSVYMGQWYEWETQVLAHFNTRHQQAARFGTGLPNTEATRLLEQVGEPSDGALMKAGLRALRRDLEEDERVRLAWGRACERHRGVVEGFISLKEGILREGFSKTKGMGGV